MGDAIALEWRSLNILERGAVVLSLTVALMSVAYAIGDYPVIGHDSFLHLNWLGQFSALREQGLEYPRWLPNGFHGLGSPAFYFYPPLGYFIASAVHSTVGGSPEQLYHIVQLSFAVVGTLIAFCVLRQRGAVRILALSAALAYSFGGYRFIDVYIRNAFGEHAAIAFLPLLLLEWRSRLNGVAITAVTLSALLWANVPMAVLGGIILLIRVTERPRMIYDVALGGAIAALATAVYWCPVVSLSGLIRTEHLQDDVVRASAYVNVIQDVLNGALGRLRLVMILTLGGSLIVALERWRSGRRGALTWLLTLTVVLQLPYVTDVLWQRVPPFTFVQFPWRLNAVAWMLCCYGFAFRWRSARTVVFGLLLTTLAIGLPLIPKLVRHDSIPDEPIRYDAPEHATRWVLSSTWAFYYFAMNHQADPDIESDSGSSVAQVVRSGTDRVYDVMRQNRGEVQLHLMYWPYWRAYVNGKQVAVRQKQGLAVIDLPAGHSRLELRLEKSDSETLGLQLSVLGASLLICVLGAASYSQFRRRTSA